MEEPAGTLESINRAVRDEMVPPKELVENLPDYVNNAIMRAMAVNPKHRFQNVDQFEEALSDKVDVILNPPPGLLGHLLRFLRNLLPVR